MYREVTHKRNKLQLTVHIEINSNYKHLQHEYSDGKNKVNCRGHEDSAQEAFLDRSLHIVVQCEVKLGLQQMENYNHLSIVGHHKIASICERPNIGHAVTSNNIQSCIFNQK